MKSEWKRNKTFAMVQTDRFEQAVIKALSDLYRDAQKDIEKLTDEFNRQFYDADMRMRQQLTDGKITKEYYRSWRQTQIGRGKRWETMKAQMADRMNNADKQAAAYINNTTPSIYALNHDFTCFQIDQAGIMEGGSFTLVNERTIRELVLGGNHVNFRVMSPNPIRNYQWNAQRIQRTLTVGLLSGKSTDKIASDFLRLMGNNRKAAIRNARTAVTSAQNAGCQSAFDEATEMGIQLKKEWMCTHDDRTRESHVDLDGQRVDNDKPFSNGLMYPGDPSGVPAEVYNCRCTMRAVLPYMEKNGGLMEKQYAKWRESQETEGTRYIYELNSARNNGIMEQENISSASWNYGVLGEQGNYINERGQYTWQPIEYAPGVYVNRTDSLYRNAKKIPKEEGYSDIVCHSDEDSFEIRVNENDTNKIFDYDPELFADIVKASNHATEDGIRLISCKAGAKADGTAKRFANKIGKNVLAANTTIYVDSKGNILLSDDAETIDEWYQMNINERPKQSGEGDWIVFKPD